MRIRVLPFFVVHSQGVIILKKLILVRHGVDEGGRDDHLTETGRRQITDIAKKLVQHVNGSSILMLASTALRAIDSAEILSKMLEISFEPQDLLWSGGGGKVYPDISDFEKLMEIVSNHPSSADVVVFVTHYEYVDEFPEWFGRKHLNASLRGRVIPRGTAFLIDCEQKQMTYVK